MLIVCSNAFFTFLHLYSTPSQCYCRYMTCIRLLNSLPSAPLELPYTRELQSLITTAAASASAKIAALHSIDILSHTISAFCPSVSHSPPIVVPGVSLHQPTAKHQDIFEFLTYLLDALHSELSSNNAPQPQLDVWNEVVSKFKLNIDDKSKNRVFGELAKSPISKLFFTAHRSYIDVLPIFAGDFTRLF